MIEDQQDEAAAIAGLMRGHSLEVVGRPDPGLERALGAVAPGTAIYVSSVPRVSYAEALVVAARVRRAGYEPVLHLAARKFISTADLDATLARAAGEAGVTRALVIAGDMARPEGPYHESRQLLASGLFEKHGIIRLGIAGHPEGSPKIAPEAVWAALADKEALARERGLELTIVTQFCFDAAPILVWLARLRETGSRLPVRIGLAGPASVRTLMKLALLCGVGNSMRALGAMGGTLTRLLAETGPEPVIRALARQPEPAVEGLHFFAFGGLERTAKWAVAIAEGRFAVTDQSFAVRSEG